jgi:hypothetical protein
MGRLTKVVTLEEVLDFFNEKHPIKSGNTNEHARGLLNEADKKFNGSWACVSLCKKDILNVMLPHHISERGRIELIPRSGLTVLAAAEKIESISVSDYHSANPTCWEKIAWWKGQHLSPVFLSSAPLSHEDYRDLVDYNGHLIHIDGLHRLIAWVLSKYEFDECGKGERLLAYVAGGNPLPEWLREI